MTASCLRVKSPQMGVGSRLLLVGAAVTTQPALAQRTDDNATTAAQDAFGTSVGDQYVGIYNAGDIRGFSPIDAGNVRIEGLYFDLQANLNSRIVSGSTIRVGLSAQGYPFPAPTGIVDYTLQKPGDKLLTSVGLTYGPWRGLIGEVDLQVPIDGERLGLAAGVDFSHEGTSYGSINHSVSTALIGHYAPKSSIEVTPFWMQTRDSDQESSPYIFTSGAFLPKRAPRNEFKGQYWADYRGVQTNYGIVARAEPLGFDVRLGVFRSLYTIDSQAFDILSGVRQDGTAARRRVVVERGDTGDSYSGELRIARSIVEGGRQHSLIASLRVRRQNRAYGGAGIADLGASRSDIPDYRPEPLTIDSTKTRDRVTQTTVGLVYELRWPGVGELTAGVQKAQYFKRVTDPDPLVVFPETRDRPLLVNAAGAIYITPQLVAYAGYTRGLEESALAPSDAININEAPPAIRTQQKDAGLRWKITAKLSAVAGVFDVVKPYFNVDPAGLFRQLGNVRHRGIELSLAGQIAPNLTAVVGNTLIDAKVSGEEVDRGLIKPRPIGTFTRHTIASLNYRLPWHKALSLDAYFEGTSGRTANAANTLVIPARAIVNLGARYRLQISGKPVLVRAQVGNVTNTFGWNVGSSGAFTPNGTRRFLLSLSTDI